MLLSVHVTSILFLVQFNNFALTMDFYWELHALTLVACSYALLMLEILTITNQPLSSAANWTRVVVDYKPLATIVTLSITYVLMLLTLLYVF